MALTDLERAEELIAAMEARRDVRLAAGNIGEWQTELNEVRRALVYLARAVRASKYPEPKEPDDY